MNDKSSFYIERKNYLSNLKRNKENSSPIFNRAIDVLNSGAEEGLRYSIKEDFKCFDNNILEDDSTLEERYIRFMEDNKIE